MKLSAMVPFSIAAAAMADFVAFPDKISCRSTTGTEIITRAQLENAVLKGKRSLIEKSASNIATGAACTRLKDPLYSVEWPNVGDISFVYKKSTDTYTFCGGSGVSEDGGYPSLCEEL